MHNSCAIIDTSFNRGVNMPLVELEKNTLTKSEKNTLTESEKIALNTIRRLGISRKNRIAECSNLKWSTVTNCIQKLYENEMIIVDETNPRSEVSINPSYEYFVGISVGTSNIKISIIDFSFKALTIKDIKKAAGKKYDDFVNYFKEKKEYSFLVKDELDCENLYGQFCLKTPTDDSFELITCLSKICDFLCDLDLNIKSLCFAFPGTVDLVNRILSGGSNEYMPYEEFPVKKLLSNETFDTLEKNNIDVYTEHNVKAAIVAERELYPATDQFNKDKNLMLLYMGYGIGSSMILDNKLYRGENNKAGQFGHMQLCDSTPTEYVCSCGKRCCVEQAIRERVFSKINLRKATGEELETYLTNHSDSKVIFAKLFGETLCNISRILSIKKVFFSGKLSSIYNVIENELKVVLESNDVKLDIEVSKTGEFSAAIGAAICSYYFSYNSSLNWGN